MACSGSAGELFGGDAGALGPDGFAGRGGRGGTGGGIGGAGRAGQAGASGSSEPDAGLDDAGATAPDGGDPCAELDCDDLNDCTEDTCGAEGCSNTPLGAGTECGSTLESACSAPDTCDGDGACLDNHAANGDECADGSCALGECIAGGSLGCPAQVATALPFDASWRTVGGVVLYDGTCDVANTPDFAVLFTAPATATYRFDATGLEGDDDPENEDDDDAVVLADSVITVVDGACQGLDATQLGCNDDIQNQNFDSRVELALSEGQTVTVYAGEVREVSPGGGSGTLRITRLPE
jgi:hypothetical protein